MTTLNSTVARANFYGLITQVNESHEPITITGKKGSAVLIAEEDWPIAQILLDLIQQDPFVNPPRFEKLVGDLTGAYSRRINIQHRIVYQALADEKIVKIIRFWSNYE